MTAYVAATEAEDRYHRTGVTKEAVLTGDSWNFDQHFYGDVAWDLQPDDCQTLSMVTSGQFNQRAQEQAIQATDMVKDHTDDSGQGVLDDGDYVTHHFPVHPDSLRDSMSQSQEQRMVLVGHHQAVSANITPYDWTLDRQALMGGPTEEENFRDRSSQTPRTAKQLKEKYSNGYHILAKYDYSLGRPLGCMLAGTPGLWTQRKWQTP